MAGNHVSKVVKVYSHLAFSGDDLGHAMVFVELLESFVRCCKGRRNVATRLIMTKREEIPGTYVGHVEGWRGERQG